MVRRMVAAVKRLDDSRPVTAAMNDGMFAPMSTMKGGEAAAISGIQGKASTQKVVEAIMSAEQALQVAISVRDKVVQAYQEIGRMAI